VATAEPPCTRHNSSKCQISSETRAEPLTEGVKALRCGNRSGAAGLRRSWNRLTPSAAWRRHLPLRGRNRTEREESEEGRESTGSVAGEAYHFEKGCAIRLELK